MVHISVFIEAVNIGQWLRVCALEPDDLILAFSGSVTLEKSLNLSAPLVPPSVKSGVKIASTS